MKMFRLKDCERKPNEFFVLISGFSPPPTRSFCFGKRTKNHFRPCAVPSGFPRLGTESIGCGTRFAQTVLAKWSDSVPKLGRAQGGTLSQQKGFCQLIARLFCGAYTHKIFLRYCISVLQIHRYRTTDYL